MQCVRNVQYGHEDQRSAKIKKKIADRGIALNVYENSTLPSLWIDEQTINSRSTSSNLPHGPIYFAKNKQCTWHSVVIFTILSAWCCFSAAGRCYGFSLNMTFLNAKHFLVNLSYFNGICLSICIGRLSLDALLVVQFSWYTAKICMAGCKCMMNMSYWSWHHWH